MKKTNSYTLNRKIKLDKNQKFVKKFVFLEKKAKIPLLLSRIQLQLIISY